MQSGIDWVTRLLAVSLFSSLWPAILLVLSLFVVTGCAVAPFSPGGPVVMSDGSSRVTPGTAVYHISKETDGNGVTKCEATVNSARLPKGVTAWVTEKCEMYVNAGLDAAGAADLQVEGMNFQAEQMGMLREQMDMMRQLLNRLMGHQ